MTFMFCIPPAERLLTVRNREHHVNFVERDVLLAMHPNNGLPLFGLRQLEFSNNTFRYARNRRSRIQQRSSNDHLAIGVGNPRSSYMYRQQYLAIDNLSTEGRHGLS